MARAVTSDHVLFNECIPIFRPKEIKMAENGNTTIGYLLLDFRLGEELEFEHFKIEPTYEVRLPGAYASFIAPVHLPKWLEREHNAHLFTIALASVFSFATRRTIKAPRDGYISRRENLDESSLNELAIQFPVLIAGPGAHDTSLSKETLSWMYEKLKETFKMLYGIPYEFYENTMQSIRLVHLSHLNKRDDFGLAYYLLVSSMETMAKKAVKRKEFVIKHPKEDKWKEIAKTNKDIEDLLKMYKEERGKSQFLGKRVVEFIMKYCPPGQWLDLEHPRANMASYIEEITGRKEDWYLQKQWYEKYPQDFTEDEIRKILNDLYVHRSKFTHEGKNPPHQNPDSSNRFFDTQTLVTEKNGQYIIEDITLPNFQLVSFIANLTIQNYLKDKFNH
ncbi:hypothetical protein [Aerococcus viridans]